MLLHGKYTVRMLKFRDLDFNSIEFISVQSF